MPRQLNSRSRNVSQLSCQLRCVSRPKCLPFKWTNMSLVPPPGSGSTRPHQRERTHKKQNNLRTFCYPAQQYTTVPKRQPREGTLKSIVYQPPKHTSNYSMCRVKHRKAPMPEVTRNDPMACFYPPYRTAWREKNRIVNLQPNADPVTTLTSKRTS